jgi:predicted enzyme related to lactoylglutathione lyase
MASRFIWYELMTSDLKAAEKFYKAVVGWDTEDFGGGDFPYIVVKAGETGVGGLMNISAEAASGGARPGWMGYIHAADVDAKTDSIKAAGGKVHRPPADIPDVGRFSVVADPQGAMFMLLAPQGPDQPSAPAGTSGHVGWRELYADDWEQAFDFYSKQFGWTKDQAMDMGDMGTYQLFSIDGEQAGGIMNRPPNVPAPYWGFYFNVAGIDAAAERVTENGGQIQFGPMEVPGGSWIVNCMDPQGAQFSLASLKR